MLLVAMGLAISARQKLDRQPWVLGSPLLAAIEQSHLLMNDTKKRSHIPTAVRVLDSTCKAGSDFRQKHLHSVYSLLGISALVLLHENSLVEARSAPFLPSELPVLETYGNL